MIEIGTEVWIAFNATVVILLLLDLGLFHRRPEKIPVRRALIESAFWILLSLAFNGWVTYEFGAIKGLEFLTGYILEKSLSVDNLFVFLLIFSYFKVPAELQHRVLFLGILGALIMRGVFIYLGVTLVREFHWVLYLFGAFLIYSGFKLLMFDDDDDASPENALVRKLRKHIRLTDGYRGERFMVVEDGVRKFTPLFLVLVAIETSDVLFAIDSIPAVFGVTQDPFIVYTSNIMAILGLRALYFALAGLIEYFHYLNYGLAAILIFIGAKMLAEKVIDFPVIVDLGVIAVLLGGSMLASVLIPKKTKEESDLDQGSKALDGPAEEGRSNLPNESNPDEEVSP